MPDCLFCKIINGEIDSSIVFEDERVLAIRDINPQAPVHILVMPKKHIANLEDVSESDIELLGYIQYHARNIARKEKLNGHYRLTTNCGEKAGQVIFHLHYHLLGDREME